MEYYVNSKTEEETIYEIYKACRLCGAGAGYKMPIIQNVVNLTTDEVELKQKIRECVQIEVHQDDKMPPLICELCVDKVNDFYEFMDMCKQTNKKTRLRLGLPPQTLPQGAPDAGDCILGVTEPVFINDDSNEAILTRKGSKNVKIKKEPEVKSKLRRKEDSNTQKASDKSALRSGRSRQPSPPRLRGTKRSSEDDVSLSKLQKTRRSDVPQPKSILKKVKVEDSLLQPRSKRSRDSPSPEPAKPKVQNKKVKISLNIPKKSSKPEPKSSKLSVPNRSSAPTHKCQKCKMGFKTSQGLVSHMKTHTPPPKVQKPKHSPPAPRTRKCSKCEVSFPLSHFDRHRCTNKRAPSLYCCKCKRKFLTTAAAGSHERSCKGPTSVPRKPSTRKLKISPELMAQIKPLQVRLARCDPLLEDERCRDVSNVKHDFGLDKKYTYPYLNKSIRLRIKSELAQYDSMVNIEDGIKDEFDLDECYVHWDSESEIDSDMETSEVDSYFKKNNVKQLSTLSLKVLFSNKLLGKVPKKLRKIKSEKPFDSILNSSEIDSDIRRGIDNIIDSLEDTTNYSKTKDEDALFDDNKGPGVKNSDFDSIFNNHDSAEDFNEKNKDLNKSGDEGSPSLDISEVDSRLNSQIDVTYKLEVNDTAIIDKNESNGANIEINSNKSEDDKISLDKGSIDINNDSSKLNEQEENKIIEDESTESKEEDKRENEDLEQLNKIDDENTVTESKDSTMSGDSEANKDLKENMASEIIEEKEINKDVEADNEDYQSKNEITRPEENEKGEITTDRDSIEDNEKMADESQTDSKTNIDSTENEAIDYCKRSDNVSNLNNRLESDGELHEAKKREHVESEHKDEDESKINGDSEVPDKFNMDDLEDISDTDMDDKKLMEALDAQIGESDTKNSDVTDNLLDKSSKESDYTKNT